MIWIWGTEDNYVSAENALGNAPVFLENVVGNARVFLENALGNAPVLLGNALGNAPVFLEHAFGNAPVSPMETREGCVRNGSMTRFLVKTRQETHPFF